MDLSSILGTVRSTCTYATRMKHDADAGLSAAVAIIMSVAADFDAPPGQPSTNREMSIE